jgi:hypothetical protein
VMGFKATSLMVKVPRNLSISYAHEIVVLETVTLTCKALSNNSVHTRMFEM